MFPFPTEDLVRIGVDPNARNVFTGPVYPDDWLVYAWGGLASQDAVVRYAASNRTVDEWLHPGEKSAVYRRPKMTIGPIGPIVADEPAIPKHEHKRVRCYFYKPHGHKPGRMLEDAEVCECGYWRNAVYQGHWLVPETAPKPEAHHMHRPLCKVVVESLATGRFFVYTCDCGMFRVAPSIADEEGSSWTIPDRPVEHFIMHRVTAEVSLADFNECPAQKRWHDGPREHVGPAGKKTTYWRCTSCGYFADKDWPTCPGCGSIKKDGTLVPEFNICCAGCYKSMIVTSPIGDSMCDACRKKQADADEFYRYITHTPDQKIAFWFDPIVYRIGGVTGKICPDCKRPTTEFNAICDHGARGR